MRGAPGPVGGATSSVAPRALPQAVWSRMPSMPIFDAPDETEERRSKEDFWSWIFVWQRFSFQRLLTWERNTCTQPRQLAGTTNYITLRMAELWKAGLARSELRMVPRVDRTRLPSGRSPTAGARETGDILVVAPFFSCTVLVPTCVSTRVRWPYRGC